jgi:tetratricopeptide (TPR) repeat protein/2-polyprenyl-3-methyl-5-hydroxy-6-metoxy-1,4-benzoquinol methylase
VKQGVSPDVRGIFAQAVGHHQAGRLDEAVACYHQALLLKPDLAAAHNNLGNALCEQGKFEKAELSYRRALTLQPNLASAHNNLGTVLWERGKLDDAAACYRDALSLESDYFEAHNNLGTVLREMDRPEEGEASIRRALVLAPGFTPALDNLGGLLKDQGRLSEARAVYRRLLEINPEDSDGLNGLARALAAQGDAGNALETVHRSLRIRETANAKRIFVDIVTPLRWTSDNPQARRAMTRALTEAWARPGELARTAASLIKQGGNIGASAARAARAWPRSLPAPELFGPDGPTALADDELLLALLVSAQNADVELERFLTNARRVLLEAAASDDPDDGAIGFYAALARQCFINEYVFFNSKEEVDRAGGLRDALAVALETGTPISSLQLLAVAAYFPLYSLSGAARLLDRTWPLPVSAVLVQQVREPQEEAQLSAAMPSLTPIEDAISRQVQNQYEENPYPRWVRVPIVEKPITIAGYLRQKFPFAAFQHTSDSEIPEILSAGCGTGQLALELAQGMTSRVLAVDLSLKSLGYAKRKALELGLPSIEFAQADLLELGDIGRSFDLVECSGVLHHLADPFAGWRMLLSLLRPGGFMTLGLYSKIARRGIGEAQRRIAQWGYTTSAHDIRRCRQDLLDVEKSPDLAIANSDDFFGVSSCRDLLFHTQEHWTELPAIAAFLRDNDLIFLGFETDDATLLAYRRRFPGDPAATNLRNWDTFESENPDTFSGMYRFWIQKNAHLERGL